MELALQKQLLHVLFVIAVGPTAKKIKFHCDFGTFKVIRFFIFILFKVYSLCYLQLAPTNVFYIVSRESSPGDDVLGVN